MTENTDYRQHIIADEVHINHVAPMLLSEIPGHRSRILAQPYVFVQPKLDGWRIMANTKTRKIYTRSGREITTLPHINAALPTDGPEWLDGEAWREGATCDTVQSMVKRGDASLEFHVFDYVGDEEFGTRIFTAIAYSNHLLSCIKCVETFQIRPSIINDYYNLMLVNGYEGIVIRLDGHGYEHGRSVNIFKMKPGTEVM